MKKTVFIIALSGLAAFSSVPARANDANTVFNGISAATGVIGLFQRSNTNRHLNALEQGQQESNYREYRRDQSARAAAAQRAEANRRAAAQKAQAAKIQAASAQAKAQAVRDARLESLKYN